jgi:hypothetical protein
MIRSLALALALALAAAPAWAAGPGFSISGARTVGIPELPALARGPACGVSGSTTIHLTFSDPDGIAYAALDLGAVRTRPDVSAQAEASLWLPNYARPARAYRWRYEDTDGRLYARHTISAEIDLVPSAGPIWTEVIAKDGRGAMTIRRFALRPDACR